MFVSQLTATYTTLMPCCFFFFYCWLYYFVSYLQNALDEQVKKIQTGTELSQLEQIPVPTPPPISPSLKLVTLFIIHTGMYCVHMYMYTLYMYMYLTEG